MAKDRTRYFRIEARELLDALSRGLLDLERAPADGALVARLLRHAHTLKGAARVVQQPAIGDLAHAIEDGLNPHREEGAPPVPRERIDELLRVLDEIAAAVGALEPPPSAGAAQAPDEAFQAARVDLREVDRVLDAALEAGTQVAGLRREVKDLDRARELVRALADRLALRRGEADAHARRHRALLDELARTVDAAQRALEVRADRAARDVEQVRAAADRLRLIPARGIFAVLERAARDAARELGREIVFETEGGDVRVAANVLAPIREALLHAARNAVAHGVEPPGERANAGKPTAGRVRIEIERRAGLVAFRCRDDGRGLDRDAIVAAAVRRGLVPEQEARSLDADALPALLLRGGGISTSAEVTSVAGRGVGLDVVRDVARRLGAEVAIRGEPRRGTVLELIVPASLTALPALHVEVGGAIVSLPLDAVRETLFVPARTIVRTGDGRALAHGGALVPFVPLEQVLRRPAPREPRRAWSAVVLASDGAVAAVGADRLAGTGEVVVRGLPSFAGVAPEVAGAALDAEGNPRLVLDPAALVRAARTLRADDQGERAARPPVLVVDDSLTTRMLEQSILEAAGYEVDLAVSAEEALAKARARRYGVFIIDVEMPGMDGFELVRVTRADPRLAATPAILVTSRGAPEDRRRGLDAGASAYIVKSEFEQGRLLAIIEELVT
jgi:two-component system chemotaxis sensor kinase CheA